MSYTHVTAPTQFVEAGGIRFAYRRFGAGGGVPLFFMPHYRAGMDHWDPAVTDGFAASRPVILFDNAGVAGQTNFKSQLGLQVGFNALLLVSPFPMAAHGHNVCCDRARKLNRPRN